MAWDERALLWGWRFPDWHRLIEICALSNTLILDEDGIYDSTDFNDRLLLGLKGTMSEAVYDIKARQSVHLTEIARSLEEKIAL